MPIEVERRDGSAERTVLCGMVFSRHVLGHVAARWGGGLFASRVGRLVGGWCVEHWGKFRAAPGDGVRAYFSAWAESCGDREAAQDVGRFLDGLSADAERVRSQYTPEHVLDVAGKLFNRVRLEALRDGIDAALRRGDVAAADALVAGTRRVEMGLGSGIDVLEDDAAWDAALAYRPEVVIEYPGALGEFFGDSLRRGGFVGIQAGEKIGKSVVMQDMVWQAVSQGRRVAYFEAGDSVQRELLRRWAARLLGRPLYAGPRGGLTYRIPTAIYPRPGRGVTAQVEYEEKYVSDDAAPEAVAEARRAIARIAGPKRFKLSCHAASSLTVADVAAVLDGWQRDDWLPDVICIAEGSLVLTDRGQVPIENVKRSDKLWDGVSWVTHQGVVYKGVRDVVEYCGLTATPDHKVWTRDGWRTLESCARLRRGIAHTGEGGKALRLGADYVGDYADEVVHLHQEWAGVHRAAGVRLCPVCQVQCREVGFVQESVSGHCQGLPGLRQSSGKVPERHSGSTGGGQESLYQPQGPLVAALRGTRYRVPIPLDRSCLRVGGREFGGSRRRPGVGSYRQRWSLRTGQSQAFDATTELFPHPQKSTDAQTASFAAGVSACPVCGRDDPHFSQEGTLSCGDRTPVGVHTQKVWKSPVWDIVGAGPLHRFTVQGLLVHNCVDYPDILSMVTGLKDQRDRVNEVWKALRAVSQTRHALVLAVTQADAASYESDLMRRRNFSEDKRKYGHVTAMYALNQRAEEKRAGVYRINCLANRDSYYDEEVVCHVAGCREIARPFIVSAWDGWGTDLE